MGSNRFYITVVLICLLIFGTAFLFFYFLQVRQQPSTAAGIAILALLLTIRLIYYINRTNRMLENVSTGILCFDDAGKILTLNQAAAQCLKVERLTHLDNLEMHLPGLGSRILEMRPDTETTETIVHGGKSIQLAIHSSQIKLKKERVHIIALNDISNQMEEQEILSWKRLIRVINHEIMNSMTPIITLAMAIRRKLANGQQEKPAEQLTREALEDAIQSASIIEERSMGLVQFIERYKKLTSLPPMKMERFFVGDLFAKLEQLFKEEFHAKKIRLNWSQQYNAELEADRQMLEQVLINLVKNSVEALNQREDPEIELSCFQDAENHICLAVRDNGEGIQKDKLEQVFVPFFTTRKEGSGIGLSLCKQIIRSHNGSINIESTPGEGTRVIITL